MERNQEEYPVPEGGMRATENPPSALPTTAHPFPNVKSFAVPHTLSCAPPLLICLQAPTSRMQKGTHTNLLRYSTAFRFSTIVLLIILVGKKKKKLWGGNLAIAAWTKQGARNHTQWEKAEPFPPPPFAVSHHPPLIAPGFFSASCFRSFDFSLLLPALAVTGCCCRPKDCLICSCGTLPS